MNLDAKVDNEIFRKDHPMILAANRHLASIRPVRVEYNASGYKAGRVLGQKTADSLFKYYNNANSDGSETAQCVMFEDIAVEAFESASGTAVGRGIFGGELYKSALTGQGLDAAAIVDLKARTIKGSDGVEILKY